MLNLKVVSHCTTVDGVVHRSTLFFHGTGFQHASPQIFIVALVTILVTAPDLLRISLACYLSYRVLLYLSSPILKLLLLTIQLVP